MRGNVMNKQLLRLAKELKHKIILNMVSPLFFHLKFSNLTHHKMKTQICSNTNLYLVGWIQFYNCSRDSNTLVVL